MGSEMNSQVEFYINGVAILTLASLGVIGNIICVFLFTSRKMKMNQTFTNLLIWLAVIDSLFLVGFKLSDKYNY